MTTSNHHKFGGVGATAELSLRVSVASLARVVFGNPKGGEMMLALENKATLLTNEIEPRVIVRAHPFGGAVRIINSSRLQAVIEEFHFDSERSRYEKDFRIFIRPSDWHVVRDFCLTSFKQAVGSDMGFNPDRELVEEFDDAMGIYLRPDQYVVKPIGAVLEKKPLTTGNINAIGIPTGRIYLVYEAQIVDPDLSRAMVANSEKHSSQILSNLALDNARKGGRGRANAVIVLSMQGVRDAYLTMPADKRHEPLQLEDTILDGNVPVVLEGVYVPKYQKLRYIISSAINHCLTIL